MNCQEFRQSVDLSFESGTKILTIEEQTHLVVCADCKFYYDDLMKTEQLFSNLRKNEPVLNNPEELTDRIMVQIDDLNERKASYGINKTTVLLWTQRLLAAASVALFLTFSFEQFIVVDKITRLENKLSGISADARFQVNSAQFISMPDFPTEKLLNRPLLKQIIQNKFNLSDSNTAQQKRKASHD